MDLNRVSNQRKLHLCKCYFKAGLALLPFVWMVNAVWFFKEAFKKPPYTEQNEIKKYVIMSLVGTAVWVVLLIGWITTYQMNRQNWGEFGDAISFIIPLGST